MQIYWLQETILVYDKKLTIFLFTDPKNTVSK